MEYALAIYNKCKGVYVVCIIEALDFVRGLLSCFSWYKEVKDVAVLGFTTNAQNTILV